MERQRLPEGFLERLIEYRSYAAAKHLYDRDPKAAAGGLMDDVKAIEFALAREAIEARRV